MKFKDFIYMYDNWNGVLCVNDNNLDLIVKGNTYKIITTHENLHKKQVVAFGFYDNELCVRVK